MENVLVNICFLKSENIPTSTYSLNVINEPTTQAVAEACFSLY